MRHRTFREGFPELVKTDSTKDSSIPSDDEHKPVKPLDGKFGLLSETSFKTIADCSCGIIWRDGPERYGHENDIVALVRVVVEHIASTLNIDVRIAAELCVLKVRADLWILTRLGIPIGAIEIKKPDRARRGVMNNAHVLGELFDQLLWLDNFYGKKLGIGILITGEEVRVCWRGEDDGVDVTREEDAVPPDGFAPMPRSPDGGGGGDAAADAPRTLTAATVGDDGCDGSPPGNSPSKRNPRRHKLIPCVDADVDEAPPPTAISMDERQMYVSPVLSCKDTRAMQLIISALMKMSRTTWKPLTDPFADLDKRTLHCFVKDSKSTFWSRDLRTLKEPQWDIMKKLTEKYLFAVEDLGHGDNGRVWLTSTIGGYIHVLKCPISGKADRLKKEYEWWVKIYPEFQDHVGFETWSATEVLRMPHFAAILDSEREGVLPLVKQCLRDKFADKGYKHNDVKWRNIGMYTGDDGSPRVVVYDLDGVCMSKDDNDWVQQCMDDLRATSVSHTA